MRRGATWVMTGGARGITARCALELGRRFRLQLHLIGSSPYPETDPSWHNLSKKGLKSLKTSVILRAKESGEPITKAWQRVEKAWKSTNLCGPLTPRECGRILLLRRVRS